MLAGLGGHLLGIGPARGTLNPGRRRRTNRSAPSDVNGLLIATAQWPDIARVASGDKARLRCTAAHRDNGPTSLLDGS
jgi:hypothetical protein